MRFQQRIFALTFVTSAALLVTLTASVEESLRDSLERQYRAQYGTLAQVIGSTLRQMETATGQIANASARSLYNRVSTGKIPSEEELQRFRTSLGISQLVLAGEDGTLLRDTETPPKLRTAKIFDFCAGYRNLLRDAGRIETTPILPSFPSGEAYIFSLSAAPGAKGLVEAGVHVRFIVETLGRAMRADPNIKSIGLYTPKGLPLGYVGEDDVARAGLSLPHLRPGAESTGSHRFAIVTEVPASVVDCCECKQKGLVGPDGRYYYLLRTEVSLHALHHSQETLRLRALLVLAIALLAAAVLSILVSRRLVKRLHTLRRGVLEAKEAGDLRHLKLTCNDEIGELAASFETLSSRLAETQHHTVELEKSRALGELATRVAHDIRSPLAALKAAMRDTRLPEEERELLQSAASRIHDIAEDLLASYREQKQSPGTTRSLASLAEEAVAQKRLELGNTSRVRLTFEAAPGARELFSFLTPKHLARVLSNLLNNAVEASSGEGTVAVRLSEQNGRALLTVSDHGRGIPAERIPDLLKTGGSFGKAGGTGLGLVQARETVEQARGQLRLRSEVGKGTTVELDLPLAVTPAWHLGELVVREPVVIVDDVESVHRTWEKRLRENGIREIEHLFNPDELARRAPTAGGLFLVDQEFRGFPEKGIELIRRLGLVDRSVLVTSHADDPALREECARMGLRLVGKDQLSSIPVRRA